MDTIFLTLEQLLIIHDDQIERYGGSHGIRDLGLLESALLRPQTTFGGQDLYLTIFHKAASLLHSLLMNHAFVDGNKRTAVTTTLVFLELNGYTLSVSQDPLVQTALQIENKKMTFGQIVSWLKKHSKRI